MPKTKRSQSLPLPQSTTSKGKEDKTKKAASEMIIVPKEDEESSALVPSVQKEIPCDFIPEEIILSLTSTAYAGSCPEHLLPKKGKSTKDLKPILRSTNNVWHHPVRRNKFQHLTDFPIFFKGAGRDISFLYDIKAEKIERSWLPKISDLLKQTPTPYTGLTPVKKSKKLTDTLIPEEFHVVSSTGVEGLQFYDDKYTTLLTDSQNRLLLFPSMKPNKRVEVAQLKSVMDAMLEKAGVDDDISVHSTKMHKLLEKLKTEQNIYNTVFHEIIRQISVDCADRGELLSNIRQRYVKLLDQIARQMIDFYKDMVAQRIMDKRIIEELFNFKNVVEELSRELFLVREYDIKLKKKSEKIHEELMLALCNAEKNARIVEEYHDLYSSQRARMESDIKQLTTERDIWCAATYELALKVIEKNNLILAKKLYLNEKAWNNYVTHFIVMLASQDSIDLAQMQKATQQWRSIFRHFKFEMEHHEENVRQRIDTVKRSLQKMQNFLEKNNVQSNISPIKMSAKKSMCAELKKCNQMLSDDADSFGGDKLVEKVETLKIAFRLQTSWTELGKAIIHRHRNIDGETPAEQGLMEEISRNGKRLCREYEARVNGAENGFNRLFISINSFFELWVYKMESVHPVTSMTSGDWKVFYGKIPELLSLLDKLRGVLGVVPVSEEQIKRNYVPVVQINLFNLIQQWILTLSTGTDKDNIELHKQLNEIHITMIKWLVDLIIIMVPDHVSEHTIPKTEMDITEDELVHNKGIATLELEGIMLAKTLSRFSIYIFSCCKSLVASVAMKKEVALDPQANKDIEELVKIKRECIEWVATCNLLLSELKGRDVSLLTPEDTRSLYDYELIVDGKTYNVTGWEETLGEMAQKKFEEIFEIGQTKETKKEEKKLTPKIPLVRFLGIDKNVRTKPLVVERVLPTGEEVIALAKFNNCEKERYESLGLVEHLQTKLLDTEVRVQLAEEKYEEINEKLTIERLKNQELEKELDKIRTLLTESRIIEDEEGEEEEPRKPGPSEKRGSKGSSSSKEKTSDS
ncbi:axonemal dynein light chain domain-containing protein 1 isoform X2 [Monodelphis domestica]|uniref:axonemal dynein light chain domain-containing protein 1 isoform X2 n=1 Tax=Monodelphis domestica TaxID=13616 RepID=UPI0024E21897|nr:axonemal dynein light chain domain-containing protein 1 isoform X2 [Monodelphis domestica]